MVSIALKVLLVPLATLLLVLGSTSAQLSVDYYSKTCPNAEEIVRKEMIQILSVAPSLVGPFLRLHFHDCFVRVCYRLHDSCFFLFFIFGLLLPVLWCYYIDVFLLSSCFTKKRTTTCLTIVPTKTQLKLKPFFCGIGLWWFCFAERNIRK